MNKKTIEIENVIDWIKFLLDDEPCSKKDKLPQWVKFELENQLEELEAVLNAVHEQKGDTN